jgi:membrane protease YdiL (CAAX protease family)
MEPVDAPTPATLGHPVRALRSAPERLEIALILGLVLLLNLLPGRPLQIASLRWGILVTQIFFIAAPVLLGIRWFYLDRRAVLPIVWPGGRVLAGAVLGAVGLNHVINYAVLWQDRLFPLPEGLRALFESLGSFDGPLDFLLLLLLLGVVPGVCEEILFRGFVQAGLRQTFESGRTAIVVGALVFAGFHLNPWRFDVLLIIGLYLGYLVQRTGSLVPSMVAHALINILSVCLGAVGDEAQNVFVQSSWSHLLACVCLAAAALLLRRASA